MRAMSDLSTRSASVPEAPENRKNGAMNSAPASITSEAAPRPDCSASRNVTTMPERALQQVVVEGAEELRDEERREPTGGQELDEWRSHDNVLLIQTVVTAAHAAATRRSLIEVMRDGAGRRRQT